MAALAASPACEVKIARCFAFVGPASAAVTHISQQATFLADALSASIDRTLPLTGSALRSYLYAGDLTIWLWTILFRGQSMRAYNVGSEDAVSIAELARQAAGLTLRPRLAVSIAGSYGA